MTTPLGSQGTYHELSAVRLEVIANLRELADLLESTDMDVLPTPSVHAYQYLRIDLSPEATVPEPALRHEDARTIMDAIPGGWVTDTRAMYTEYCKKFGPRVSWNFWVGTPVEARQANA